MRKLNFLILAVFLFWGESSALADHPNENLKNLDEEIAKVNQYVEDHKLPLKKLTKLDFKTLVAANSKFLFPKEYRGQLKHVIAEDILFPNMSLQIEEAPEFNIYRTQLEIKSDQEDGWTKTVPLVDGQELDFEDPEKMADCEGKPGLCEEPLFYPNLTEPSLRTPQFESTIGELVVTPSEQNLVERPFLKGFMQPSLQIKVKIDAASIPCLVEYFGKGQDPKKMQELLEGYLSKDPSSVIDIKEIMPPAVKHSLYRIPLDGAGEHDVCYNAASTFYNLDHAQGDNSTELLESILNRYYCKREKLEDLRFGDILYRGEHAVRYVMYDAKSDRHIVYQMNSGGYEAWRFLYLDEAFQYEVSEEKAFQDVYDAYYRCK